MKWWVLFFLALGSLISGLIAAYKWWRASQVEFRPFDEWGNQISTSDYHVWINAMRHTIAVSGARNKSAAIWTAVSVGLAGVSALANLPSAPN